MLKYEELLKDINILMIDDDEDFVSVAKMYLTKKGYNIDVATGGVEGLEAIKTEKYQIVLLDYFMPGMNGEEVVKKVREYNRELIIILQTGFAGAKPPIETMQSLDIQNYHDKTEGMDKLNLLIISAVKIFKQQNEIAISKYRNNSIGRLIKSISNDIKQNLTLIGASLEMTNVMIKEQNLTPDLSERLDGYYNNSKKSLMSIDEILSILVKNNNEIETMSDHEIEQIIKTIIHAEIKASGVKFNFNKSLRAKSYITGDVTDYVFLTAELILQIIQKSKANDEVNFIITEDGDEWYFTIESSNIDKVSNKALILFKNVCLSLRNLNLEIAENNITIKIKK